MRLQTAAFTMVSFLVAVASVVFPCLLLAATQTAPTDRDTPGRQPYEYWIPVNKFGCLQDCINFDNSGSIITFDGPVVPLGKRLVIQTISGLLPSNSTSNNAVVLQTDRIPLLQMVKWGYYGPFFPFADPLFPFTNLLGVGFSTELFVTYDPGERPHFLLLLPDQNSSPNTYVSVSGYLIDASGTE